MAGKFEINKSKNGKFLFNLKAGNGQIILSSQMYEAKTGATQGVESCRTNGVLDERFRTRYVVCWAALFQSKSRQWTGHWAQRDVLVRLRHGKWHRLR